MSHLGVHQQILLAVGLAVFCYCVVLGCIFCCRRRKSISAEDKEAVFLSPCPVSKASATLTHTPCTQPVKQQYEELDGDVLEYPLKSSSSPSEDDLTALPCDPSPTRSAKLVQSPKPYVPLRLLSSPAVPCSPDKAPRHGRASLPSLTKLSFVSKSCRAMGRRRTVSGESFAYSESSHLTAADARAAIQQEESCLSQYGSNSSSVSSKSAPLLHFSLLFSSACGTLVVKILAILLDSRKRNGVFVRVSLPPLCPVALEIVPRRRSLSPDPHSQSFVLQVGSVEELRTCTLKLAVHSRDFSGLREATLGLAELPCDQMDWEPDIMTTHTRQLSPPKRKLKKSVSSQETLARRKTSVLVPLALGQLLILLQYQALAQRIKVMVRKADSLAKLTRIPGTPGQKDRILSWLVIILEQELMKLVSFPLQSEPHPSTEEEGEDHYVVINLRQDGKVIATKETKGAGGPNPTWNAPFLFDLPQGDITQLPLALEFIIMQGRLYTKSSILGRVLIGCDASEAGQGHWREMCTPGQIETTRWHSIQSDAL